MITITQEPNGEGKYTAYLPIIFKATESSNPDYLYFILRNADNTAISGIPTYKAPNINNEFTFDAASYLKNYFNVRTIQGASDSIVELTDIYGNFEVVVNTIDSVTGGEVSNEFYAFAWIDNYVNIGSSSSDETADYGINKKGLLLSNDLKGTPTLDNFPNKRKPKETDYVSVFVRKKLFIDTYSIPNPNNSSTILETAEIDLTTYLGKLIAIPIDYDFIQTNFLIGGTTALAAYQGFRLRDDDNDTCVYYHVKEECNEQPFLYINRYGCKEIIYFDTTLNENFSSKGQEYKRHGYDFESDAFGVRFATEAPSMKINQENKTEFDVKGQYFRLEEKEALKDFFSSPFHITFINGSPYYVNVVDGTFKISQDSRGLFVNFKYRLSQDKLAFV